MAAGKLGDGLGMFELTAPLLLFDHGPDLGAKLQIVGGVVEYGFPPFCRRSR